MAFHTLGLKPHEVEDLTPLELNAMAKGYSDRQVDDIEKLALAAFFNRTAINSSKKRLGLKDIFDREKMEKSMEKAKTIKKTRAQVKSEFSSLVSDMMGTGGEE